MKLPLQQPHDLGTQNHEPYSQEYNRSTICYFCHHPIHHHGTNCKYCKYSNCSQLMQNFNGVKQQKHSISKSQSSTPNRSSSYNHFMKQRLQQINQRNYSDNIDMDLTYITERVIAMTFPFVGMEKLYRDNLREVTRMLKTKHADKYMIFNLSGRRYDIVQLNQQVLDFGWPDRLAPPLERLCSICKAMDSWLNSDVHHVAVLHCKGGKERTGIVVEAYRHYSNICASADQALDRFTMKRFYDDKTGVLIQPSQKRYLQYFSGLLSAAIKINSSPLYLHQILINGVPNFDGKGGCRAFIKIYQSMQPIYASGIYNVTSNMGRVVIPLDVPLQLRGDILIKCYHKSQPSAREVIFRCQFHTCAISENTLILRKNDLDDACQDKRFPDDGRVELNFSSGPDLYQGNNVSLITNSLTESSFEPLIRWDSYENFDVVPEDSPDNLEEIDHWIPSGPMDGSLYATVGKKKPASSTMAPINGGFDHLTNGFHTTSMDSGISFTSGNPGRSVSVSTTPSHTGTTSSPAIMNGTASVSPSPMVCAEIHNPSVSDEQSKLDEALSGMLENAQSMPDIKPLPNTQVIKTTSTILYTTEQPLASQPVQNTKPYLHNPLPVDDDDDSDTPYHARKDSQPFSYLVPTSPSTQRKRIPVPEITRIRTPSPIRTITVPDDRRPSPVTPTTPEPRFDEDFIENPNDWLYKQKQKLKERHEAKVYSDRHYREQKLIHELRNAQSKIGPLPDEFSFDDDAYLSDTLASLEAFSSTETSPMKGENHSLFSTPLHINTYNGYSTMQPTNQQAGHTTGKPPIYQSSTTGRGSSAPSSPLIPSRTSSRDIRNRYIWPATQTKPLQRQRSDTSHDRERPFVIVKHAYEQARQHPEPNYASLQPTYTYSNYQTPPPALQSLQQSPYSHMVPLATSSPTTKQGTPSSGLLTTVTASPTPSKLAELELSLQAVSSPPLSQPRDKHLQQKPMHVTDGHIPNQGRVQSPTGGRLEDRPGTPGFPVHPSTPYTNREPSPIPGQATGLPPKSPTSSRRAYALNAPGGSSVRNQLRRWPSNPSFSASNGWSKERSPSPSALQQLQSELMARTPETAQAMSPTGQSSPSVYVGQSCRSSLTSLVEPSEIISHTPVFMKDTSKFWYKPNITREAAINALKDRPPGTFIVRDSNSFPGAYGLALKVATPPPNVQNKSGDISNELVRHFLIEPTTQGVRLKGCANEPVFSSLSALVYQHSITPMALPCKLLLPETDIGVGSEPVSTPSAAAQLLNQGAACSVLYLDSVSVELLTGPAAIKKSCKTMLAQKPLPTSTVVHFKVSSQGITVTDNQRKLFFRRHYPVNTISHCGLEPGDQKWCEYNEETGQVKSSHRIFGFVAAKATNLNEYQCHLFAELEPEQPAFAIVNFVTKVMMGNTPTKSLSQNLP